MWLQVLSITKSAIDLARDVMRLRKAKPVQAEPVDAAAGRAGTVAGASAYEASRKVGPK